MTQRTEQAQTDDMTEYLAALQTKAMRLQGLLEVANFVGSETAIFNGHKNPVLSGGRDAVLEIACELAGEVNKGLDCSNLPKVKS